MKHKLSGDAETREVYLDGEFLDSRPSYKYHNHSPDGYNWGYGGSGPAQLALAIMLKLTGKPLGYQDFKFKIIGAIPQGKDFDIEFELPAEEEPAVEKSIAEEPVKQDPIVKKYMIDETITGRLKKVELKSRKLNVIPMYYENDRKKIVLSDGDEPIITATVDIPGYPCEENQVYIRDYKKNTDVKESMKSSGILEALINAGVIYPKPVRTLDNDYPRIFLMLLMPKAMKLWKTQ